MYLQCKPFCLQISTRETPTVDDFTVRVFGNSFTSVSEIFVSGKRKNIYEAFKVKATVCVLFLFVR